MALVDRGAAEVAPAPEIKSIAIDLLVGHNGWKRAQLRACREEDPAHVEDLVEHLRAGKSLPPVAVYFDAAANRYQIADGFHTLAAHRNLGRSEVPCAVRSGDLGAALKHACAANAEHGLKRTGADKRRQIETALAHPEMSEWSNRAIAEHVCVSDGLVASVRQVQENAPAKVVGRDGRVQAAKKNVVKKVSPAAKRVVSLLERSLPSITLAEIPDVRAAHERAIERLNERERELQRRREVRARADQQRAENRKAAS